MAKLPFSHGVALNLSHPDAEMCLSICMVNTDITFIMFLGVSCDSCMKANFKGRRYKCLVCYDYDLCATCHESGVTAARHSTSHPMQCILTRSDFGRPT